MLKQQNKKEFAQVRQFALSLVNHQSKLHELKLILANYGTQITGHPERNITRLRQLVFLMDTMSEEADFRLAFITFQKLLAFSIVEIFKDIIPAYKVKEQIKEEVEGKRKLKSTTRQLRDYETTLITIYKLYLLRLRRMVEVLKKEQSCRSTFYRSAIKSRQGRERICMIGIKCFSELLITHSHFNFTPFIIQNLVPCMTWTKHPEICSLVCKTVCTVYRRDKLGAITYDLVKETAKLVKACGLFINPEVLSTFLSIKIRELVKNDTQKPDMKNVRKKLQRMSRKEKRRKKEAVKLDRQLMEADAAESEQRVKEFYTRILNQVFVTYFRILKRTIVDLSTDEIKRKRFKILLTPILEGLSRFSHQISIDYFDDMTNILFSLTKNDMLDSHQSLHCNLTVFTILTADIEKTKQITVDYQRFYAKFYEQMMQLSVFESRSVETLFRCFEAMLVKKRRQLSLPKVLAFLKRMASLTLSTNEAVVMSLLFCIRRLFIDHPKADILLDVENSCGGGVFRPEINDPEYANANSSALFELVELRNHFDGVVRRFNQHVIEGCRSEELRPELTNRTSADFYRLYDQRRWDFIMDEKKAEPKVSKKSKRFHGLLDNEKSLFRKGLKLCDSIDDEIDDFDRKRRKH